MEKRNFKDNTLIEYGGKNLEHIIIIPIYTEPYDVIEEAVLSVIGNDYRYKENLTILLASESRAPHAVEHANEIIKQHGTKIQIINIVHPDGLPDEGKVK
jgi:cellulose synthase/poly-beta-1,6-N-acetylglucosamine synthase-like glycosyltransferase